MLLGMLYPFDWRWSDLDWLTSTFDTKIAFFLILAHYGKIQTFLRPGASPGPKNLDFFKIPFQNVFPSSRDSIEPTYAL